jgi:hypothetical protein
MTATAAIASSDELIVSGIPPAGKDLPPPLHRRGKKVLLADDREWMVPPLPFRKARQAGDLISKFFGMKNWAEISLTDTALEIALVGLTHNYPTLGLTLDDMQDLVDAENVYELIEALFSLSGLRELLKRVGLSP